LGMRGPRKRLHTELWTTTNRPEPGEGKGTTEGAGRLFEGSKPLAVPQMAREILDKRDRTTSTGRGRG